MKLIDLVGQKFGKLTVVSKVENRGEKVQWLCKCDCGKLPWLQLEVCGEVIQNHVGVPALISL